MQRPYEGEDGNNQVPRGALQPGLTVPGFFLATKWQWDFPLVAGLDAYSHYVMGWIEYEDAAGSRYRMAFCRHWNYMQQRFEKLDDPDYEHG